MTEAIQPAEPSDPDAAGDDDPTIEEEFQTLFADVTAQSKRLSKASATARLANDASLASALGELSGTSLELLKELIALTGDAFSHLEERIDDVEGGGATVSVLLPADAEKYVACLEQNIRLLTSLMSELPDVADEQKAIFETLRRMNEDRLAFTNEITAEPDEDDDEKEGEQP